MFVPTPLAHDGKGVEPTVPTHHVYVEAWACAAVMNIHPPQLVPNMMEPAVPFEPGPERASTTDEPHDVATAWHERWLAEEDADEIGPPGICEGCSRPATERDSEGVDLCTDCWQGLVDETAIEEAAKRLSGDDGDGDPNNMLQLPDPAD